MNIQDFIAIGIVGVILSGIINFAKKKWGVQSNKTKVLTVALSLIVGAGYVWLRATPYFETVLIVLGSASTVYALVIKK